jgi:dTDP-4-amino-4,6-dideoxygalactose transaminase
VAKKVEARVLEVLRSGRYIGGPDLRQLESKVAARMGAAHGVGVGSGTDGLRLALEAVGVGPGDEVIVPAMSFFATAGAVLQLAAVPVVVDVLPERLLMDPAAAKAARSDRTRAVVPVHLFGSGATLPDVDLPIVVDAAQAMGAAPALPCGDLSVLSFYPTKVLGGAGDGGMVLGDDLDLLGRVRGLANHGGPTHAFPGTNSRLDAIQAAVLLVHLDVLDDRLARRRSIAARLDLAVGGRALPRDPGSPVTVWALRHPERERLAGALEHAGIDARVYYPAPLSELPAMVDRCRVPAPLSHAIAASREVLSVPCHADLTDDEVDRIVQVLEAQA